MKAKNPPTHNPVNKFWEPKLWLIREQQQASFNRWKSVRTKLAPLIVTSGLSVNDVSINNDKPQLLKSKVLTANTETKYVQLHANLKRCLYCSQNLFNSSTAKSIST